MYHYTYRISNTKENKHYYGVRSSKVEPKLDLGIKYFSSSTDNMFIKEQKENKSIFKYKVIKMFENRIDAMNFEIKLHKKFNVGKNLKFYNMCNQTSTRFSNISTESICKMKNSLNIIGEDGFTPSERAHIAKLSTTQNGNAIYKDGLTYNEYYGYSAAQTRKSYQHIINKKVSETKQKRTLEEKETAKLKFNETMNETQQNGLTKMQNKANKHSEIMKNRTPEAKEAARLKFIETMNIIGSDGLTGYQRRAIKRNINKVIKETNEKDS